MIRQIANLFARYAERHVRLKLSGNALTAGDGSVIGQVEDLVVADGVLTVTGWADANSLILAVNGAQTRLRPDIDRADVRANHPELSSRRPGFVTRLPYRSGGVSLALFQGDKPFIFPLDGLEEGVKRRARLRQVLPFGRRLLWSAPLIVSLALTKDSTRKLCLRQEIKRRLELESLAVVTSVALDPSVIPPERGEAADQNMIAPENTPLTIVLPVYNALPLLQICLQRVVDHTDLPWHLVLIEDCSSDAEVRPWLRSWVNTHEAGRITYLENDENLGFVGSVNRGLEAALDRGNAVVLLNSDAFVPAGWAQRLLGPLLNMPMVASVTPMSNDAEIFGSPEMCVSVPLEDGYADVIDAAAARCTTPAVIAEAPTCVGFCAALHIDALRAIPQLDHAFGRGYGEEVDWCQKARALGWRHLGHGGLYVEHRGGQSFGGQEKLERVAAANAIIKGRYPNYDRDVQDFIAADPMRTSRVLTAIAWAAERADRQGHPLPVYLAHQMGGGAEHYLENRIACAIKGAGKDAADVAIVLRVGGTFRWQIEVRSTHGCLKGGLADFEMVPWLLAPAPALDVVYSNAVGDPDPVALPDLLLGLKRGQQDRIEVLVHDYFPISPSYTLLDDAGHFHGVPEETSANPAHQTLSAEGCTVTLAQWRASWDRLVRAADRVVVFAQDGADMIQAAFPGVTPVVIPHTLKYRPFAVTPPPKQAKQVIGVLGNLNFAKGAKVLADLADYRSAVEGMPDLVLIGNIDPAFKPVRGITIHGSYAPEEISTLARRYAITSWFIPSIWPETFSFTTHECLATQLPVWTFDLGAQAEAVRSATLDGASTGTIPLDWATDPGRIMAAITSGVSEV